MKGLSVEKIPKSSWDYEYKTYVDGISDDELVEIKNYLNNEDCNLTEEQLTSITSKIVFKSVKDVVPKGKLSESWLFSHAERIVQFATLTGGSAALAKEIKSKKNINSGAFILTTKTGKRYLINGKFNTETRLPRCKVLFADKYLEVHPGDLWTDIKTTGLDNEGVVDFQKSKKPEKLIARILKLVAKPGDIVLDSFLGSGTTAAVAHKLGMKWIGIEMGEHIYTHCKVRLDAVINGEDHGGITSDENWQGGGGYRFYELAPSLIEADKWGQPVISKQYDANMLAAAVAKHEGYSFNPDPSMFWKQSQSTEKSYLFVTDRFVDTTLLQQIHDMMGEDEALLISCSSFESGLQNMFSNIYIKKIPDSLLTQCEFGVDNYALNIVNPPVYEEDDDMWEEE